MNSNMYDEYNNQSNNMNNNQYVNSNNMNNNQYVNPNYNMDNSIYVNPNNLNTKNKKNPLKIVTTVTGILIVLFLAGFGLVYTGVIKINYVSPKSMLLNVGNVALKKGREYQLEYQVYPESTSVKNVYFESSDPSVMEVNEVTGYVTAKKNGSAYVVVKTKDNDKVVDTTLVTVTNDLVPAEKLILSSEKLVFDLSNASSKLLKVSTEPSNATDKKFDFFSGDENVAIVDEKGYVTPVGFGRTKINVTTKDGSVKTTCDVVVTDSKNKKVYFTGIDNKKIIYPYAIELETDYIKLKPGTTRKVGFTLLPPDVTEDVVSWISADSKIATVKDGVVKGEGTGITTVTAITVNDLVAKLTVEITNEDVEVTQLEAREEITVLTVGEKKSVNLKYNDDATDNKFTYSSNNIHVATINEKGIIEGINVGETDVIVTTSNNLKVTIHVVVNPLPSNKDLAIDEKDITIDVGSTIELPNTNSEGEKINGNWIIDDDSVISIDDDVAQGTVDGTTNIGYVDNDGKVTYLPVSSNSVLPTKLTIESYEDIKLGDNTKEIEYVFEPVNTTDKSIKWSYSEEGIIEIDEQNIIKTLKVGKVTVTATSVADESIFTTFDVNVTKKDVVNSKPSTSQSKGNSSSNTSSGNTGGDNTGSGNTSDGNNTGDNNTDDNNVDNSPEKNENIIEDKEVTGIKFRKNMRVECPGLYPYLKVAPNLNVKVGESVEYVCANENDVKVTYKGTMMEDVYSDLNVSNIKVYKGDSFAIDATVKINGITSVVNSSDLKFNFNSDLISYKDNKFYAKKESEYNRTTISVEVSYKNLKKTINITIDTKLENNTTTFSVANGTVSGAGTEFKPNLTVYKNGEVVSTNGLNVNYVSLNPSVVKVENNRLITQDVLVTSKATIKAVLADDRSVYTTFEVTVIPVYKNFKVNSIRTINNGSPLITGSINRNGKDIFLSNGDFSSISFKDSRISYSNSNNAISYEKSLTISSSEMIVKYNANNKEYTATSKVEFFRIIKFNSITLYPGECKDIKDSNNIKVTNITIERPKSSNLYVKQNQICAVDAEISSPISENVNIKYDGLSKSVGVTLNKNKYSNLNLNDIDVDSGGKIYKISGTVKRNNNKINITEKDLVFDSATNNHIINKGNFFEVNKKVNSYKGTVDGDVLTTDLHFSLKNDRNVKGSLTVNIHILGNNEAAPTVSINAEGTYKKGAKVSITKSGDTDACYPDPGHPYDFKNKGENVMTVTDDFNYIIIGNVVEDKEVTLIIYYTSKKCSPSSTTFKVTTGNNIENGKYESIRLVSKTLNADSKNVTLSASAFANGKYISISMDELNLSTNSNYITINKNNTISVNKADSVDRKATITASLKSNPSITTTGTITISRKEYNGIKLVTTSKTLNRGKTYQLDVQLQQGNNWVSPSDMNKLISYTSTNDKYATVDSNGKVTIVAPDSEKDLTVTITAKLNSNDKTAKLTITIPANKSVNNYTYTCYKYKPLESYKTVCSSKYVLIGGKCYLKANKNACKRKEKNFKLSGGICYNETRTKTIVTEPKYKTYYVYSASVKDANKGTSKSTLKCKVSCNKLNSNNVSSNCKK